MDQINTSPLSDASPYNHDVSEANIVAAMGEFIDLLSSERVSSNREECIAHSRTPWSPAKVAQRPALIVFPGNTSQVSQIMKICSRRRIPVVGYSGGTSFHGALTATSGGICVDFKFMDNILALHADDLDVVVQPAVEWQELNAKLSGHGLFFPPDPGPGARIGGMIAMNCSGTNAYRYGTMKAWVIAVTVVLADGSIVKTRQRPRKSAAGYDLTSLVVGSEGTLGLVTEAVLKVTSAPLNLHVAVARFPSTQEATRTVISCIRSGLPIDALELIDKPSMAAINCSGFSSRQWEETPTLFLKFSGSLQTVQSQIYFVQEAAKSNQCNSFEVTAEKDQIEVIWGARKCVAKALNAIRKDPTDLFLHADAAVPISKLAVMMEEAFKIVTDAGLFCSCVGHVGDGNFHAAIVCSKLQEEGARKIITHIQERAVQLEGTITGEHGIGLELRDSLIYELGDSSVDMMRRIKLALDPLCILNPDKVIRLRPEI